MTLGDLVVTGGILFSFSLAAVLASLWPSHRPRTALCLKARADAGCDAACLRSCPLLPSRQSVRLGHLRHARHAGKA